MTRRLRHWCDRLVSESDAPMVLDADGLNAVRGAHAELSGKGRTLVITPHPGEMARLADVPSPMCRKIAWAWRGHFAREHDLIVVLKGHRTLVVQPDGEAWVNTTGNPGMSTGGTGDILTGMVAAMIAQNPQTIRCWRCVQLSICTAWRATSCVRLSASTRWSLPICCADCRSAFAATSKQVRATRISLAGTAEAALAASKDAVRDQRYLSPRQTDRLSLLPQNAEPHPEFPSRSHSYPEMKVRLLLLRRESPPGDTRVNCHGRGNRLALQLFFTFVFGAPHPDVVASSLYPRIPFCPYTSMSLRSNGQFHEA